MRIGSFEIGQKTLIIAEIGNNHLGDPDLAHRTLDAAADAGVDAVKFQLYRPELLITADQPVLKHVPGNVFATQRERFAHMVLAHEDFAALALHAGERGVLWLCTPFDRPSADFLEPLTPAYKIASGDTSHFDLIDYLITKGKPLLVSTGLCEQREVDELAGRLPQDRTMLLHCVGAYPTPDPEAGLGLIPYYRERYGLPIGYSDHTPDLLAPLAAVALGAVAVEKHFILDKSLPGGDRALSLDPGGLKALVRDVRRLESMLAGGPRRISPSEVYGRKNLRRSVYTRGPAQAGARLSRDDLVFLRPELEEAHPVRDVLEAAGVEVLADLPAETALTVTNSRLVRD